MIGGEANYRLFAESLQRPVVLVHGFRFDPDARHRRDRPDGLYDEWRSHLGRPVIRFGYYAAPAGLGTLWKAWRARHWNTYSWAWELAATQAAPRLARLFGHVEGPVDVMCHSLGSRVVLEALQLIASTARHRIHRVLLLNGAEHRPAALAAARRMDATEFLNVCVETDAVLSVLGGWFSPEIGYYPCIGHVGLGPLAPANWHDVQLDDPDVIAWGDERGMDLAGDRPGCILDHWWTQRHVGNWKLYRGFLDEGQAFLKGLPGRA